MLHIKIVIYLKMTLLFILKRSQRRKKKILPMIIMNTKKL